MAKAKRARSKKLVLDLGSSAVRLCELTPTKSGYQLTKFYQREFPIDPSMDDEAQRDARKITVANLLKEAKVRAKKTVFGVPGQSVFTRTRTLPPVPEYKVTQIVRYEIQQQIPFQLDQIAHDYQVLQRTEAGGYDVLMAAIKVDVVDKRLELIKDIKRQVDIVDVCPLAAYNWLKYAKEFGEAGECVALIDLGAATTDIVIERDNQFRFTRSLNLGGNDVTSAVAAEFNMQWAQAEKLKRERGFAPTGDAARDGKGGEVIGRVLNRLVSEITRSFAYFRSQPGGGPVNRIVVTGGGACLRNMIPFLQRQLGIEVRIAQPLAGLAIAPGAQEVNEHPEQAAVALGLALRCCEQVTIGINLIPPRILEAARRREAGVYWLLSVATLILIMLTIVPAMAQQSEMIDQHIDTAKKHIGVYDPGLQYKDGSPTTWTSQYETDMKAALGEITQYRNKIDGLDFRLDNRRQWINDLVAINNARPRGRLLLIWGIETTQITPPGAMTQTAAPKGLGRLSASNKQPDSWGSTGFEGIEPGTGVMMGLVDPLTAALNAPDPMNYNGMTILGYAESIETMEEFLVNLKASGRFLAEGIYFDERFADPVPFTEMDNAGGGAGAQPVSGSSGGDDDGGRRRGGGRMDRLRDSTSVANPNSSTMQWNQAGSIVSFRVDVQYRGEIIEPTKELAEGPGGAGGAAARKPAGGNSRRTERESGR
ncbi:MAG: type IV pilus assembly protein PilM [Candidatus Hydrogenedentes bacterium]|nr:type IV pilus assembly protein PilM [Candidatus Hydrogenedentota bacterium]